jgi:O-antigen ligase
MTITNKRISNPVQFNSAIIYSIALVVGFFMGRAEFADPIVNAIYALLSVMTLFYAARGDLDKVLKTLPYFIYLEIYKRANGTLLPYLYCEYVMIAVFGLLILQKGTVFKVHSKTVGLFFLFTLVEILNSVNTENDQVARALITHTVLMFTVIVWSSTNVLTAQKINIFLNHIKIAGAWLCGFILVAHITGNINYGLQSSAESTHGLAPVQISAYLGFLSILFFLAIVNETEKKNLFINIVMLVISSTIMLLSFSRGGLYFLAAVVGLYFLFNAKKMSNYFLLLLLIPVGIFVYYLVTTTTNGLIEERYGTKGASGRDVLVQVALKIFWQNPVTGIGTGNFNTEITKLHLYEVESGAHDEFVRVLAEHGILGIFYWAFYIVLFVEVLRRKKIQREYGIYFLVLFCLILVHNALKLGLQPAILMLVIATPSYQTIKKKKLSAAKPGTLPDNLGAN